MSTATYDQIELNHMFFTNLKWSLPLPVWTLNIEFVIAVGHLDHSWSRFAYFSTVPFHWTLLWIKLLADSQMSRERDVNIQQVQMELRLGPSCLGLIWKLLVVMWLKYYLLNVRWISCSDTWVAFVGLVPGIEAWQSAVSKHGLTGRRQ